MNPPPAKCFSEQMQHVFHELYAEGRHACARSAVTTDIEAGERPGRSEVSPAEVSAVLGVPRDLLRDHAAGCRTGRDRPMIKSTDAGEMGRKGQVTFLAMRRKPVRVGE